jgi:hypothetical protein
MKMTKLEMIEAAAKAVCYDADDAMETAETFADYDCSTKGWREGSYREDNSECFPIRNYFNVQMFKGQARKSFTLVDCGDFCLVFGGF